MFVLALLLAVANPVAAPQPVALDDRLSMVSGIAIDAQHAPGGAVAVVRNGRIIYAKGFGLRNVASDTPTDADTRFEIGSVTKQFTAAAILQLKERGKLSLDDTLAKYVPMFPHAREITLRQLLNQVTGLPNYTDVNHFVSIAKAPGSVERIEGLIAAQPLHFKPGTKWEYSNTNYVALGRVIEVVSGQTYADYIRNNLFAPAGMTHSTTISGERSLSDFATPYWRGTTNAKKLSPAESLSDNWVIAAGDIVSTVGDLAKWDIALQSGKIVSPTDFALMETPGKLANGASDGYGFGLQIDTVDGRERVWHNGGTFGSSSSNVTFPQDGVDVIVLENEDGAATAALSTTIYETMFPNVALAAMKPGTGEDPAVTARLKLLLGAAIKGSLPPDQLSPLVRATISQKQQQQIGEQLATLGAVKDVIFKRKFETDDDNAYVYRVDFANAAVNFFLWINKNNNLVDGIRFGPST